MKYSIKNFLKPLYNPRFMKFGIVGTSGIVINNSMLWFLVEFTYLPFYLCSFIAIELSIISNFMLNDFWTWHDRKEGSKFKRFLKYNTATAFSSIFINITVLLFLKEWVNVPYILANLAGIGCAVLFNFLANDNWTYGKIKFQFPVSISFILLGFLVYRLVIGFILGPGFDEAYYYIYSLNPSLSYFDHPPFVGFLAGFFPYLTGITDHFFIRLGAILLFSVSSLILYKFTEKLYSSRIAFWTFILFNITPLYMLAAGTMILPDSGLVFFWLLTLWFLYGILIEDKDLPRYWILAGIFTGLAMLSKYHGIFLIVGTVLYILVSSPRRFLKKGIWLYISVSIIFFSPVIIWNVQNNFISFTFQGARAVGSDFSFNRFFQGIGGQIGFLTPFIFIPLIYVALKHAYISLMNRNDKDIFIAVYSIFPLILVLYLTFYRTILPHWTLPLYILLLMPYGKWLAEKYYKSIYVKVLSWITLFFIFGVLSILLLHSRFGIIPLNRLAETGAISKEFLKKDPTLDSYGWNTLGEHILQKYAREEVFLFTHKWFLSGQVGLAVKGEFSVLCFNEKDSRGFGIWDSKLDMRGYNGLFVCSNRFKLKPHEKYQEYFESIRFADSINIYRNDLLVKTFFIYECEKLLKMYPIYLEK